MKDANFIIDRSSFITEQFDRYLFPLGLQASAALGPAGPVIPVAGVSEIPFLAVQVGMNPRAGRVLDFLGGFVRRGPVAARVVPQREQRAREGARRPLVGRGAFEFVERHAAILDVVSLNGFHSGCRCVQASCVSQRKPRGGILRERNMREINDFSIVRREAAWISACVVPALVLSRLVEDKGEQTLFVSIVFYAFTGALRAAFAAWRGRQLR